MKKKIDAGKLMFFSAMCFYAATVIGLFTEKEFSAMFFCLGSAMLCIGCSNEAKKKKDAEKKDEDNEE